MDQHVAQRFWAKVDKSGDCWLWTAARNNKGYPVFRIGSPGKLVLAHRYIYGDIPPGDEIDHRATCPKHCVNPDHLRLATRKQNQENRPGPQRNTTSGVRGVTWARAQGKWKAQIGHNGRNLHVGYFDALDDAAEVVWLKRIELFIHNDQDC